MRRHLSSSRSAMEPVQKTDGRLDRQEPLSRWLSTSGPSDEWCGLETDVHGGLAFVAKVSGCNASWQGPVDGNSTEASHRGRASGLANSTTSIEYHSVNFDVYIFAGDLVAGTSPPRVVVMSSARSKYCSRSHPAEPGTRKNLSVQLDALGQCVRSHGSGEPGEQRSACPAATDHVHR